MATRQYPAVITPRAGGGYSLSFVDFASVTGQGEFIDSAAANGRQALEAHIAGLTGTIPQPSKQSMPQAGEIARLMVNVNVPD